MPAHKGHNHGFKKGQKKKGGRGKGVPNKITAEVKEFARIIVEKNMNEFQTRMKRLEDKDFCNVFIKVMEWAAPKQQRIAGGGKSESKTVIVFAPKDSEAQHIDNVIDIDSIPTHNETDPD